MAKHKAEKELRRRYGMLAEDIEPYCYHLDLRPLDGLDDDAFAFIMKKVKGVNMLDLNETEITIESIRLLTHLEYVTELRVKGCRNLDNCCIEHLNKLISLEFLDVRNTGINIEGILRLTGLTNLKELMFSVDDTSAIGGKMRQLRDQLPGCAFTVNGRPWDFEGE